MKRCVRNAGLSPVTYMNNHARLHNKILYGHH